MTSNDSRDQATIRALRQIDPDLAGLFELGRELCDERDRPGLAYLIGHVGRELTNCLVDQLEEGTVDTAEPLQKEPDSKEDQRYRLASALGLSPNHQVVRRWFKVHQLLQSAAHARVPAPKIGPLRPAYAELADLIYGRVGDYFQTQAEIDSLADSADPAAVDVDQLARLLLRGVQRRRFFSRINRPEWLEPLSRAGFFRNPPGRVKYADGSWRPRPWPEGDYLARMASADSAQVVEILSGLPADHENPIVWFTVADAIKVLPSQQAARLTLKLARALQLPFAGIFSHHAVDATVALSQRKQNEAFLLLEALLWLARPPVVPEQNASEDTVAYLAALSNRRRDLTWSDKWILARIDEYEFERLLDSVLPALRELDPLRLVDLLADRVNRATRLVAQAQINYDDAARHAERKIDPQDKELDLEGSESIEDAIASRSWCKHLDHTHRGDSIRAHFVVELYRTVRQLCTTSSSSNDVFVRLETRNNEIVTRIVYAILADLSTLPPPLQARVDRFVASEDAIHPSFGATETAALLRAHFTSASTAAQKNFLAALLRGPGDDAVARTLEFWEREDSTNERNEVIADWQRQRLRWFHDTIPPLLQPIAAQLGVTAAKPTQRQQALDETGSWSSGVHSGGSRSPVTWQDLSTMSPAEFVTYLVTWRPPDQSGDPWDAPSEEGLQNELRSLATNLPDFIEESLEPIFQASISLSYLTAILSGLRSSLQSKTKLSQQLIVMITRGSWDAAERAGLTTKAERQRTQWAAAAVCDLLTQYIETADLDADARNNLWQTLADLARSPLVWREDPDRTIPTTYAQARDAAFAEPSARLVAAVFALAWNEFAASPPRKKWPPPTKTKTGRKVIPILEPILARNGQAAYAAHGVFGQFLPNLVWLAHDWTVKQLPTLLDRGSEDPGTRPAWSVYVDNTNLSPQIFQLLRVWYARHAAFLPIDASDSDQDPGSELAEDFAVHVIVACVTGACAYGDADAIVENTFARVPVKARNHAYWTVFRWWSDRKTAPKKASANILRFWENRLDALEGDAASASRDEELESLCWFIATPHLEPRDVIRLGQKTAKMLGRKHRVSTIAWNQLTKLADWDAAGTFVIVQEFVDRILKGDFPYLAFDDVAPSLRTAISKGGELREQALALLHRIGDAGFDEFGVLWKEVQSE